MPTIKKPNESEKVDMLKSAEDLDILIDKGIKEKEKELKEKLREELKEELRAELKADQAAKLELSKARQVKDFIDGTGITDENFGKRLISMNMHKEYLRHLRDEHNKLSDKELWDLLRKRMLS